MSIRLTNQANLKELFENESKSNYRTNQLRIAPKNNLQEQPFENQDFEDKKIEE